MKKFVQFVTAIKAIAALAFTGFVMMFTVASMFLGKPSISIGAIWQIVFLSIIFAVLQHIAFSENVFERMGTPGRILFLGTAMLASLALFALVFHWFEAGKLLNWIIFLGVYTAVYAIAVTALRIVFRIGELQYNDLLIAYKSRRNN